ncbi:hypothetical protein M514_02387 [Trichuris suis]|uniref:leucine--tRNA ligase n=1 Tax=Trichuris suis TaxID=68888 RepID=A0A085N5S9_9BILA|nr:hypothetical protein M514_02387 [Trichuris suis]
MKRVFSTIRAIELICDKLLPCHLLHSCAGGVSLSLTVQVFMYYFFFTCVVFKEKSQKLFQRKDIEIVEKHWHKQALFSSKEVIHPIGWDAFGLPADNAARQKKENPAEWTNRNIAVMKSQLLQLGCQFDWNREIRTCSPEYYKWTQWIFLQLLKAGLAYRHESFVNWDPVDLTVLATEQVDERGCSWRSGAPVLQKPLKQWFVKTSYFAERKEGGVAYGDFISIYVRKPSDLLFGRLIIVRPQHILNVKGLSPTGYSLLGLNAWNPVTQRSLPIFVAADSCFLDSEDALLVASDDSYCQKYAKEYLPNEPDASSQQLTDEQVLNSARMYGCDGYKTSRKLKDWVVSRQRFWGTPIPVIHCSRCGAVPVPEAELPITLPDVNDEAMCSRNFSLREFIDWKQVRCPTCFGQAERETDTLDTFFDSSWYYLRFLDSRNGSFPCDVNFANKYMPVDVYIGGKEHGIQSCSLEACILLF